jgi:hypothetical protein
VVALDPRLLWLTLVVALIAGWFIDHHRPTTPRGTPPMLASVPPSTPVNRNPCNQTVMGFNAAGLPTSTGPRGGVYHYSADGGKVYDKKSKVTPVEPF